MNILGRSHPVLPLCDGRWLPRETVLRQMTFCSWRLGSAVHSLALQRRCVPFRSGAPTPCWQPNYARSCSGAGRWRRTNVVPWRRCSG